MRITRGIHQLWGAAPLAVVLFDRGLAASRATHPRKPTRGIRRGGRDRLGERVIPVSVIEESGRRFTQQMAVLITQHGDGGGSTEGRPRYESAIIGDGGQDSPDPPSTWAALGSTSVSRALSFLRRCSASPPH
jgi:hypothetical protein